MQKYFESGLKRLEEALHQEVIQENNIKEHHHNFILPFLNTLEGLA
jgi:hypothetical protein